MNTLIITGHPYAESYNNALVDVVRKNTNGTLINLVDDGFDPVMREEDLAGFSKGVAVDPLVHKYQSMLMNSERLVIVTPIWWSGLPAIYKGFIDKVMLKGFAYDEKNRMLQGKLTHIKEVVLISTSQAPSWYLKYFGGNPIGALEKRVFKDLGFKNVKSLHLGSISSITNEKRSDFLNKVDSYFK